MASGNPVGKNGWGHGPGAPSVNGVAALSVSVSWRYWSMGSPGNPSCTMPPVVPACACGNARSPTPVHDGFATIRSTRTCRPRAGDAIHILQEQRNPSPPVTTLRVSNGHCHPGYKPTSYQNPMEPLYEESVSFRPRPDIPWWEIATRKSRYRSCPALQVMYRILLCLLHKSIIYSKHTLRG